MSTPSDAPAPFAGNPPIRPRAALVLLAMPLLMGLGLMIGFVTWMFAIQGEGRAPTGGVATFTIAGTCAAAAQPILTARLDALGLPGSISPGPTPDTLAARVTTPGLPDDLTHLPQTLTRPGQLLVRLPDGKTLSTFKDIGFQLAFSGTPVSLLLLDQDLPANGVTAQIDGVDIQVEGVNGPELQLASYATTSEDAVREAADRVVILRHPLPCALTARDAAWAEPPKTAAP